MINTENRSMIDRHSNITGHILKILAIIFLLFSVSFIIQAQDADTSDNQTRDLAEVYVTVQDFAVLRAGPSTRFDRLAVLQPGVTLRATGRTYNGLWLQVAYPGELDATAEDLPYIDEVRVDGVTYGWVAYWLLIWSGDILQLPIDGINTPSFARMSAPRITITPDTYYYVGGIDPSVRVEDTVDEPVTVELIGRVGTPSAGFFWLQFKLDGEYYWTASWEVGTPNRYWELPDGSYLYAYGRLAIQLRRELNRVAGTLNIIGGRWQALDEGRTATCNNIPPDAAIREENLRLADVQTEPIYTSAVTALNTAINRTNSALAQFRAICDQTERVVTPDVVAAALVDVDEALRNITYARTLLQPLERRNPLLGNR